MCVRACGCLSVCICVVSLGYRQAKRGSIHRRFSAISTTLNYLADIALSGGVYVSLAQTG